MSDATLIRHFHFTLGPVQGFVAQARRTRDFWAGSFILSWLSAVAMREVDKQGGKILFPEPDEDFMAALEGGGRRPKQGNVPNRFQAEVPASFDPAKVGMTVRIAWRALAEVVWKADVADHANPGTRDTRGTRVIWEGQIESFWDIQWALVDVAAAANTLDRMKNWRTHLPPDEPGVKCMMMDGWQELSGIATPDAKALKAFWGTVRNRGRNGIKTDLRETEHLCAIAFVKRRFARHFEGFQASMPAGWTLQGWKLPNGVPSVHYMAAAPWLAQLLGKANTNTEAGFRVCSLLGHFHRAAYELTGAYGERETNIDCVRRAEGKLEWKALDGTVFFDAMLENGNLWAEKKDDAKALLGKLKALRKEAGIGPVSPFYAVLLMDGDELGIHMSDENKQTAITTALANFTAKVPRIVHANNGFLIYVGGDDVLALVPMEDALKCAAALRAHYLSCFDLELIPTSLSGAIEYAHIKMPLGKVLHDAHDLLDNVAKEGRGRDAIACRVWKPGGLTVEWAMPWNCALDGEEVVIDQLADVFRKGLSGEDGDMASKFFYGIRERFDLLNPPKAGVAAVLNGCQALELLATEYLNSGLVPKGFGMDQAKAKVKPLLDQCRPVTRNKNEPDPAKWPKSQRLEADGALLVRFLAHKGVER